MSSSRNVPLDEHVGHVISFMRERADALGLQPAQLVRLVPSRLSVFADPQPLPLTRPAGTAAAVSR